MSYDFRLRVPAAQRKRKRASGPRPEQLQRLERARAILRAHEPDIALEEADEMFTALSAELGDVHVHYDRIVMSMSMGAEPRRVYNAIHALMQRFAGEGYEADDPQLRTPPVYHEDFATFMRQYREHFSCTDDEFEQWCRGETPPAWAAREAARERGNALATQAFPRGWGLSWEEARALSDDALFAHLQDVIRRNDAAIEEHGLAEYMQALSLDQQAAFPLGPRRLDGRYYPNSMLVPWFQGTMLHYEATTLAELCTRGHAGVVRTRPQRVRVTFLPTPGSQFVNADYDDMKATMDAVYPQLKAAGLLQHGVSGRGEGLIRMEYEFNGDDADAIAAAVRAAIPDDAPAKPARIARRYGEHGAREVEEAFSGEG
jgi:hypothetical protein